MVWLTLVLIVIMGGCFNQTSPPVFTPPTKVGFWVSNINNNRVFIELPSNMYSIRTNGSNIAIEAKGCNPYQGKRTDVVSLTPNTEFWLASLIWAESRGESLLGQAAVGQVVLNRVKDTRFNNSIIDVIFESSLSSTGKTIWQFSCVIDGQIFQAWQSKDFNEFLTIAKKVQSGTLLDNRLVNAVGFFNPTTVLTYDPYKTNWVWKQPVLSQIGNHVFFAVP